MKYVILLLLFVVCMNTLSAQNGADRLIATDSAFSALSVEKGMRAAFLAYADDPVIKLNNNQFAVRSKAELKQWLGDGPEDFTLEWKALTAEIAASGELGYTFGVWRMRLVDGTYRYSEYVTIWKKQAGGDWKFVLDGGNATPPNPGAWP